MSALLLAVTALLCMGIIAIYSVSSVYEGSEQDCIAGHIVSIGAGLCVLLLASRVNYHVLAHPFIFRALPILTLFLLVYVLMFGPEINGARRWIRVLGNQFQPSELAKITVVVFLSIKLAQNQAHIKEFMRGFVPPLIITGLFSSLILMEPDLGVPAVIVCTTFAMMFMAGVNTRYLLASAVPVLAALAVLIVVYPHRIRRIIAWLDPWEDRLDKGFHLIQSLAAFARGGIWGVGPGAGEQKLLYLNAAHTDFVFAVWAEETGLVGTLLMVGVFFVILIMGIRIAMCAPDLMGSLLATGVVSLITCQALVNICVTTGMLPTKGLPLPFVSNGGTAMVVFLGLVGILLNIARQCVEPPPRSALVH